MDRIFIDIDGTLTDSPARGGKPLNMRIQRVNRLVADGYEVVLWSATGTQYAQQFAIDNDIVGVTCIGKPTLLIDDNPNIRPLGRIKVIDPQAFFDG